MPERRLAVSIHDVMPETLDACTDIFEQLDGAGLLPVTLLVVPGRAWQDRHLNQLHAMIDSGAIVAGHGWAHQAETIRGWYHRVHSHFVSRDVAEHLALDSAGIEDLVCRCHDWFAQHSLPSPTLYVPPAWAMGRISWAILSDTPFKQFETLSGVYATESERFHRSGMLGYEADTAFRALGCRSWNAINKLFSGRHGAIRLAIHPSDLSLRLANDLRRDIAVGGTAISYDELVSDDSMLTDDRAVNQ